MTDNTMIKRNWTIWSNTNTTSMRSESGCVLEGLADRAPLVTTVVLLLNHRNILWYWMCFGNQYTIQITLIKHEHPTKQMGVKTNRTSFLPETKNMKTCNSTSWTSPTQQRHATNRDDIWCSVSVSSSWCSDLHCVGIQCVPFVEIEYLERSLCELWTLVIVWYLPYFLCW